MTVDSKIIVALDIEDQNELQKLISQLDPTECRLKIGKTLFTRLGPQWVKQVHALGFEIFLDLKFHDIPQQVAGACQAAAELGVWMINVHASGGLAMLQAAKAAVDKVALSHKRAPLLVGVTVLTSLNANDLTTLGMQGTVEENVLRLAGLCKEAKLDGVVCSAQEAAVLKKQFGKEFLCVTPGIRLPEDSKHDQQRVITPEQALKAGSDYLVIGRTITGASNPLTMLRQINQSLKERVGVL